MKAWLRSTLTQKRFNSLAVLNTHKEILDELSLAVVGNDFVDGQRNRRNEFGAFSFRLNYVYEKCSSLEIVKIVHLCTCFSYLLTC